MKSLLFTPALLCLAVFPEFPDWGHASVPVAHVIVPADEFERVRALPENPVPIVVRPKERPVVAAAPAAKPEAPRNPDGRRAAQGRRGDAQLAALKEHLDGLGEKLGETEKMIEEIARRREEALKDASVAKAEAQRHLQNHQRAMQQLEGLERELSAARKEAADWKRKAEAGALTHEALLNFRGDLTGARKQFELLQRDMEKARGELQDPVERAALKKSLLQAEEARKLLGSEIEMALKAKTKTEENAKRTQAELESKLAVMRTKLKEADKLKGELSERIVVLEGERTKAQGLMKKIAKLESDHLLVRDELVKTKGALETMQSGMKAREIEAARMAEAAAEGSKKAMAERDRLAKELDGLRKQMDKAGGDTAALKKSGEMLQEQLKKSEEARRTAARQAEEAKAALAKAKEEMAFANKAKEGLEELLFKKTAELRELRVKLRKLQNDEKQENQNGEEKKVSLLDASLRNAPKAVIVAEG